MRAQIQNGNSARKRRGGDVTTSSRSYADRCCPTGKVGGVQEETKVVNPQIPANAAWFYVLAVLAASPYPIETRQRVRRLRSRHASAAIPETHGELPT